MSNLKKSLCCLLAAATVSLGASSPCYAVAAERWDKLSETVFRHIAEDSEMPDAAIPTAISEDGDGFLWIGTQNGLSRWDGHGFRNYKFQPNVSGTLPDSYVSTLHTDPQGRLWIGTNSGGLARYDRDHDRFIVYPAGPGGLSHVSILSIADDGAAGIWVGTEGGLDHVDPQTGSISKLVHDGGNPASLPDNYISTVLRARDGTLWVGTRGGLVRSDQSPYRFVAVPLPAREGHTPKVISLFEESGGRIWIGTESHGAYVIEPGRREAQQLRQSGPGKPWLLTQQISSITESRPGEVWLSTYGQGIVAVNSGTMQTRVIRHDFHLPEGLASDNVWTMFRDSAGLIWVATARSISWHDPRQVAISTVNVDSINTRKISDEGGQFISQMPNGHVWLGLGKDGIDILDPAAGRVGGLYTDPDTSSTGIRVPHFRVALATATGEVYLGTQWGLYKSDQSAHKMTRVEGSSTDAGTQIWTLLLQDDRLWMGGPAGLQSLAVGAQRDAPVRRENSDQLTDHRVTAIERGPPGQLWIGTENGLNRLDLKSHTVEKIMPDPSDSTGMLASFINSLLTDRQGRLWVGSIGGISVLVSRDSANRPHFRRLGIADGLPNDNIDMLLEDREGNIWASTDDGLAVIDPKTFVVRAFRRASGVVISSYWFNSGSRTPEGELLFGGIGGMTVVRPDKLTNWTYHPPVVLTNVRIGGRPVSVTRFNGSGSTDPLIVEPDANSLLVEFSALDYAAPELCRYRYQLDGYDKKWTDTDAADRLAAYSNLPPGNYTLRIRGSNHDGIWTEQNLTLPIRVLPAWYQTTWFRLVELLAAIGLVGTFVQSRTRQLRHRQRELEQNVHQRTAELEASRQQLERIAYLDFLTGLPNRRMFTDECNKLLSRSRRKGGRFALLLIDLDGFKEINDTHGHDAGDALLIEVAIRLRTVLRESDTVARMGGDEFAILLPDDHDVIAVERVCQRIFDRFNMEASFKDASMRARLCIGGVLFPDQGDTEDDLYKAADLALYAAKRAGGNTFKVWGSSTADITSLPAR